MTTAPSSASTTTAPATRSLKNFDKTQKNNGGDQPHSCFAAAGSVLYGMTSEGGKKGGTTGDGTIFSYDTSTGTYTRLYSFDGKHGSDPHGQPIVDPNGTTLYGMTRTGGKADVGVIFSFDTTKKKLKVLHSFSCPGNGMPTCIDKNDGAIPDHGALVQLNSTLFGLTSVGGKYGNGVLFSIHTGGKHFKILQNFGEPSTNDGVNPYGSLLLSGTTLYGTTQTWRQHRQRHRFSDRRRRHQLRATVRFPERQRRPEADRQRHPARQHALRHGRKGRAMRQRRDLRDRVAVGFSGGVDAR